MSINTETKGSIVPDSLDEALNAVLANGKGKKDADFLVAYPKLQEYIIRGVSQRAALATFNQHYGHELQLPRFRQLLKAEKMRRERDGDVICCPTCSRPPMDAALTVGSAE